MSNSLLRPGPKALATAQDRLVEKTFLRDHAKVPVAPFAEVNNIDDLRGALSRIGYPAVLKTRRFGYDGKGQFVIKTAISFTQVQPQPQVTVVKRRHLPALS